MGNGVILIVDDEEFVRKALVRALREEPYEILEAEDAKSALQILRDKEVDVVISDLKMPGVNGLSLLRIIKDHYPDVIRIMLTGFGDMDTAIKATNEAEIFRFFTKPWDRKEIIRGLDQAIKIRKLKKENQKLINQLEEQLSLIKNLARER